MVPKLEEYMYESKQLIGETVDNSKMKLRYSIKLCGDMLSFIGANCECNEIADYTATTDKAFDEIFDLYLLSELPEYYDSYRFHNKIIKVDNLSEDEVMTIIEKNVAMLRRQNERYNTRKLLNLVKEL